MLSNILDEDIPGQELCISSYLVAEIGGERAATYGAWVEMETGRTSNMIKSSLLFHFLDRDILLDAAQNLKLMNEIEIHRDKKCPAIRSVLHAGKIQGIRIVWQTGK